LTEPVEFILGVIKGFGSLHTLARSVKIGPLHMPKIDMHSAKNGSAFLTIAGLLVVSINSFSTAGVVGVSVPLVSALLLLLFFGIVGIFINLAMPADEVFADDAAASDANKWASFFAVNFLLQLAVYITINLISLAATSGDRTLVALLAIKGINPGLAGLLASVFSSVAATTLMFYICGKAGKIIDERKSVLKLFVVTNVICTSIFYVLHFYLFSVGT
jgi:hypothetical protein